LQDGDSIYIPRFNPVVNVQGAVNSPLSVTYAPGKTIEYYIRAAGGPTVRADAKRAYVTQPNGKVEARESHFLLPDGIPSPQPGSTVIVPNRDPLDKPVDVLANLGTLTQVIAGLATLIIAIRR
jgi:protein involved in polysaccharide export with SLBB domain